MMDEKANISTVIAYFRRLQDDICEVLTKTDGGSGFHEDSWKHANGGGGRSRVLEDGMLFEKAGVNFSHVKGNELPASATAGRAHITGKSFEATGVSLVIHPRSPFIPTTHMNVRMFIADPEAKTPIWWFGGGFDLTPYYGYVEDCKHWHQCAKDACMVNGENYYDRFKEWCDDYFYLKHRNEPRGVGGIFFDDFDEQGFNHSFDLVKSVGDKFSNAYIPIVEKRKTITWNDEQRSFQCYRRGRYVEFNLVFDRGTIFGLQSGGRTESILMSMPPKVEWRYNWTPAAGTEEARLYDYYLQPRDWLNE